MRASDGGEDVTRTKRSFKRYLEFIQPVLQRLSDCRHTVEFGEGLYVVLQEGYVGYCGMYH